MLVVTMTKDQATLAAAWTRRARGTVRKVNAGWWLQQCAPWLVGGGVAGFATVFWLRSRGLEAGLAQCAPWMAGGLVLALLAGWLRARRHFIHSEAALVRLESHLGLHNALTVAAAGHGRWPDLPPRADDGWRWNLAHAGGPFLVCTAFLAGALLLPVAQEAEGTLSTAEPQAWQQMEDWLQKLEQEKVIPPEERAEEQGRIDGLRDQPKEKWFSHESLNATDTLKEQLQREIQGLAQGMSTAERSLNALQNYTDQLSAEAKDQLLKDFDEAVSSLKAGGLELDPKLLEQLSSIDPKNLGGLSKEQMDQLRESLKDKSNRCKGMCKNPGFLGDGEGEDDEMAAIMGLLKKQGEGKGAGNGGIDRGPGTAPITLSDEENRFDTDKNEGLKNADLSRAQLGSMLGRQNGHHEVDKSYAGPQSAGGVQSAGQGGEQVWKDSLTPEEKSVLKRVFQ